MTDPVQNEAYDTLVADICRRVSRSHEKEYFCHVQFVRSIGIELVRTHQADAAVVEIACLLHDIGRHNELESETHAQAGARLAPEILSNAPLSPAQKELIIACILNHGQNLPDLSLEEKIVTTADAASKVLYHEAFMLLCKKVTYDEKLAWGIKYLEKGYILCLLDDYKAVVTPKYEAVKAIYKKIGQAGL